MKNKSDNLIMLRLLVLTMISICCLNCVKDKDYDSSIIYNSENLKNTYSDSLINYEIKVQNLKLKFKYLKNLQSITLDSSLISNNDFYIHKKYVVDEEFLYNEAPVKNIDMNSLELLIGSTKNTEKLDELFEIEFERLQKKYNSKGQFILLQNENQDVYLLKFLLYNLETQYFELDCHIYTVTNQFDANYKFKVVCKLDKLMYYNELLNTLIYSMEYELYDTPPRPHE